MIESNDKILTVKGLAAVEEMDHRYKERCSQLGIDPNEWRPDLWVEANEDYKLD